MSRDYHWDDPADRARLLVDVLDDIKDALEGIRDELQELVRVQRARALGE
jgi:hypothetical protein